jgi:protein-disulfide isomerase-like protein with CxxC motif
MSVVTSEQPAVQFWFDPICPWAWMTSRWVDEVARQRPIDVTWKVMSLAYLNHGRDLPAEYQDFMQRGWGPVRVFTAARLQHGRDVVKPLYDAVGHHIHPGEREDWLDVLGEALADVGLPTDLLQAAGSDALDDELKAEHHDGMDRVGTDVGTPVIAVGDVAFFGPIVSPTPRGAAALQLWDGVLAVAGTEGFFEIKRTRTRGPVFD